MNEWLRRWAPARWRAPSIEVPASKVPETKAAPVFAWTGAFTGAFADAASWTVPTYAGLAREGYRRNPVVHACLRLVSQAVAAAPRLVRENGAAVSDHPLTALLARPNEAQSGSALLEALTGHLLLAGNAWVRVASLDGEARALHVLRPDRMRPLVDREGWLTGWEHQGARPERIMLGDGPPPVIHSALFDPLDDHLGASPLAAAAGSVDLLNAANRWNKALLDNSARPSGALVYSSTDGNLTAEQFERLRGELESGYAGASRAGRPLLLEGGLDWKAMSLSPRDMDFLEARNGAARDVALAFGVPPMLLGIPGDNTYSNYAEAQRAFWRQTVLPLATRLLGDIAHGLNAWFGSQVELRVDMDALPALGPEREVLWRRVGEADFMTVPEKRAAVGLPPMPEVA